jgi:hypothetical protein
MTLEENVIKDRNIEAASQPTLNIDFTQTITTIDAMDIDTEKPSQDIKPYHSDFPKAP